MWALVSGPHCLQSIPSTRAKLRPNRLGPFDPIRAAIKALRGRTTKHRYADELNGCHQLPAGLL